MNQKQFLALQGAGFLRQFLGTAAILSVAGSIYAVGQLTFAVAAAIASAAILISARHPLGLIPPIWGGLASLILIFLPALFTGVPESIVIPMVVLVSAVVGLNIRDRAYLTLRRQVRGWGCALLVVLEALSIACAFTFFRYPAVGVAFCGCAGVLIALKAGFANWGE